MQSQLEELQRIKDKLSGENEAIHLIASALYEVLEELEQVLADVRDLEDSLNKKKAPPKPPPELHLNPGTPCS